MISHCGERGFASHVITSLVVSWHRPGTYLKMVQESDMLEKYQFQVILLQKVTVYITG